MTLQRYPALDEAQQLCWDAWEYHHRTDRIALARQALDVSEKCADAYVILAKNLSRSPRQLLALWEAGVAAGEQALGKGVFHTAKGDFWGILETRPYMRAKAGLADALWDLGREDDAILHLCELLELNPGDNQGNRYTLFNRLLEQTVRGQDRSNKIETLIATYHPDRAFGWTHTRALWSFYQEGDCAETEQILAQAIHFNPYIVDCLLGYVRLPKKLPDAIALGSKEEAYCYVDDASNCWKFCPGALRWLEAEHTPS